MHAILQWCGLTAYQASCLVPWLWFILMVISLQIAFFTFDEYEKRKAKLEKLRKRYRGGRYGRR